jgi:branched-chain amino acid transport system ATP-binding protein/branched-chain amino acid transport system permease protein
VNNSTLFYLTNLLIYGGVDAIACLGLSQQFGIAGVTNFGFIIFQAAGAYTASIMSLPSDSANGGFQLYFGGWNLPFPIPWIGAAVVGGVLALPFTFLVGRRLRGDFAAIGLLVTAVMANLLVTNYRPFLNGDAGLSLIPAPLNLDPLSLSFQLWYSLAAIVLAYLVYRFLRRLTESPYGRSLRAMRDNDVVADSLGKNLLSMRTAMLVAGGAIAGLSGAVLVGFISIWSPGAWTYAETIVFFAAVIIGGAGNHRGAIVGAILFPVGFEEATRFIPASIGRPGLIPALQWVAVGLLIVAFLWFRPQGLLPERRRVLGASGGGARHTAPAGGRDAASADRIRLGRQDRVAVARVREPAAAGPGRPQPAAAGRGRPDGGNGGVILEAVDLVRTFDGVAAVAGVSFSVKRGCLTGLIGPNGAGKSTVLAMLAGTLPVSSGTIRYRGEDITAMPAFRRARGGIVRTFQLASEFKRLTALENLLCAVPDARGDSFRGAVLGKRYWEQDEAAALGRARALLDRFGLSSLADSYAGELSGGQRRLVEIMRALMTEPEVLLLDEPMAGIHRNLAGTIGNELLALCAEGMTILMVEHELAIMDEFCDPVVVMAEGRVLAEGTMASLRAKAEVVEAYLVG